MEVSSATGEGIEALFTNLTLSVLSKISSGAIKHEDYQVILEILLYRNVVLRKVMSKKNKPPLDRTI